MNSILPTLLARRDAFERFLLARVGNRADAEDLLQQGWLKALERGHAGPHPTHPVAWFYQLLRNLAVDYQRSRAAARRREEDWATDPARRPDHDGRGRPCGCLRAQLPHLPVRQAELVQRVDFAAEPVGQAAAALGLSANVASVTLHRARAKLRTRLAAHCGDCAQAACRDCDCAEA